jgi:hypothetical protein
MNKAKKPPARAAAAKKAAVKKAAVKKAAVKKAPAKKAPVKRALVKKAPTKEPASAAHVALAKALRATSDEYEKRAALRAAASAEAVSAANVLWSLIRAGLVDVWKDAGLWSVAGGGGRGRLRVPARGVAGADEPLRSGRPVRLHSHGVLAIGMTRGPA